ncbi:DUF1045 domain-containing protein [Chelatococcus sp. SYSU_G07232]|uniref:DUF1045 domain-containing protein n=1 Tax=Chelatococcus albus TaxID=3047466 RepID=A0ABT7AG42_9HYPH|nr:DUF1045 domain-containing protein [Chelatococcus sp. SYSU_G07232]MDJ1158340.1 DUF1045 domain-containing protein [Chelatococcus sp. SYSU_G07232]
MPAARYAIYFAPPADSALWRFGSSVIGYDGASGTDVPQTRPPGFDAATFRALTEEPRRYAFHATIKAPFRLAKGRTEASLVEAMAHFAAAHSAFTLPRLAVTPVGRHPAEGGFLALTEPEPEPTAALVALERATVEAFEPFRAPPSEEERARRRPERLSERQRVYLDRYGYPYVLEEFRFHMTLTGRLRDAELTRAHAGLAALHAAAVPEGPVTIDALTIFRQAGPHERFRILARFALGA